MKRSISQFMYSLSLALDRIGAIFIRRDPGHFERKYKFKINDKLLLKWSKVIPKSSDSFLYEHPTSTHRIRLPYHNGDITIYRLSTILEYRNWPHGRYTSEENMLRGSSIKAIGRDAALRHLNDDNFLRKVKDYVPGIEKEITRIIADFGTNDLIIISHTKHVNYVLAPETVMQYT